MRQIERMVARWVEDTQVAFCIPGHGGGRAVTPEARASLGAAAWRADVTQASGIDDVLAVGGAFAALRRQAARLWHAEETWLLCGGSSSGVHAMMLAALAPGDVVVMPRGIHLSAVWGLIASGAVPRFLPSRLDAALGVPLPPSVSEVQAQLDGAAACFVVSPGYFGHAAALRELVSSVHSFDKIVLVDEAWGAHLGFSARLPQSSMQAGADLATTSLHKMLTGLSGTAMLHRQGNRVDPSRVYHAAMAVSTTSPYYGALISIEAAVEAMARHGAAIAERMVAVSEALRDALREVPGIEVPACPADPTRVAFAATGWSGTALEAWLRRRGIAVEMATARHVLLVVGPSHRRYDARFLTRLLSHLGSPTEAPPPPWHPEPSHLAMPPREAWFARRRAVALNEAAGRVAAEPWCVYPPGIPAWLPGETITSEAASALQQAAAAGARIFGPADGTLATVQIVA